MERARFWSIIKLWETNSRPSKRRTTIATKKLFPTLSLKQLERIILSSLDSHKAEDIVSIDLKGKSDFADLMIVATGTSTRHVGALSEYVSQALKLAGFDSVPTEGKETCEWVLVDAGNIIVHIMKPEARANYNLEKMWSVSLPQLEAAY